MKGTSPAVLQKLVKYGGLSGSKYPINTNPKVPVLLISNHPNIDKNNKVEVEKEKAMAREKNLAQDAILSEIQVKVVRKMREGPHLRARHQGLHLGLAPAMDSHSEVPITDRTDEIF